MLGQHAQELAAARMARQVNPENRLALWCELRALASTGQIDEFRSRLDALEQMAVQAIPTSIGGTVTQPVGTVPELLFRLANELEPHAQAAESQRTVTRPIAAGLTQNRPGILQAARAEGLNRPS